MLSSWLLLGRPAVNVSESNCAHCAHFLEARLDLFWAEGQPSASWFVLNVTLLLFSAQHSKLQQNRNSHASVKWLRWLDHVNEVVLRLLPETPHQYQSFSRLYKRSKVYPADLDRAVLAQTPASNLLLSNVADLVATKRHWPAWHAR